jgi:hypothetical protein
VKIKNYNRKKQRVIEAPSPTQAGLPPKGGLILWNLSNYIYALRIDPPLGEMGGKTSGTYIS